MRNQSNNFISDLPGNLPSSQKFQFYKFPTDFSVCFSGGIDSTFVACYFGLKYKKNVHLVTVDSGYGNLYPGFRNKHIHDIERLLGGVKVRQTLFNTKAIFKEILINSIKDDYHRYKSNFIWCLGCTLSLHTYMIIYNLARLIPKSFYCSSVGGHKFAVMSIPVTVDAMKKIYASYGIIFSTPLLDLQILKRDEKKQLRQWSIWPGLVVGKGTLGVQPICIPGFLQHWKDIFFNLHPIYNNEKVSDFIKRKTPIMNRLISHYLKTSGVSLNESKRKLLLANRSYLQYGD